MTDLWTPTHAPGSSPTVSPSRERPWVRVLLAATPIVALVVLLAVVLWRSGSTAGASSSGPAPAFRVRDLSTGAPISNGDLRGDVAVLNFWASWCTPCKQEAPALRAVWQRTRGDGVRFVGITYQDDPGASRAFARAHGVAWTIATDPGSAVARAFGVVGVPETVVLSPSGDIVAHAVGPVTATDLLGWIRDAQGAARS